jgi:hypothetical protein
MLRAPLSCVLALTLAASAAAQSSKPPLPPGRDPGGVAIALFGTGIDYTLPEVARRLARDGEGELIGWDLADNGNRPFRPSADASPGAVWGGDGTALVRAVATPGRRVVPVKIDPADPRSLARATAFVARTPARIVVVPAWSRSQSDWEPFRQAALRFKDLLFVLAAGDDGKDIDREAVWPAAFGLANAFVVTAPPPPAGDPDRAPNAGPRSIDALVALPSDSASGPSLPPRTALAAVLAADALAGCWPRLLEAHKGEALKQAFLAAAAKAPASNAKPVIEPCPADPAAPKR